METNSLYEMLGVPVDVTVKEIKTAFRLLSKKHHPDKGGDEEIFKQLSEAYSILSDPSKRKRYDSTGAIPKSEEMLASEAIGVLRHLFAIAIDDMMGKSNMGRFGGYVTEIGPDIILKTMKEAITSKIREFKRTVSTNEKILKQLKKIVGVITYTKEDKNNLYAQTLNTKCNNVQRVIYDTSNALEVAEIAKVNLKDYVYNREHEEEEDEEQDSLTDRKVNRLAYSYTKSKKKYCKNKKTTHDD